jgi:hypothetical protein
MKLTKPQQKTLKVLYGKITGIPYLDRKTGEQKFKRPSYLFFRRRVNEAVRFGHVEIWLNSEPFQITLLGECLRWENINRRLEDGKLIYTVTYYVVDPEKIPKIMLP